MTVNSHEFSDYVALSPEDRMKARLQGLAEVISASGLPMLCDEDEERSGDAGRAAVVSPTVSAFSEGAAEFVGAAGAQISPKPDQIAALAVELNVPEDRIVAALETVNKKITADRAP